MARLVGNNRSMNHDYVSQELFHLVGRNRPQDDAANYAKLLEVIDSGWVSHPPHDRNWGAVSYRYEPKGTLGMQSLLVPTVTCFCDIPRECLGIHVTKYGKFGLGFSRRYLLRYGARPVTYYPLSRESRNSAFGNDLLKDIEPVVRALWRETQRDTNGSTTRRHYMGREPKDVPELLDRCESILGKDFLAFLKPFDADLPDDHPNQYYMEREWRKFGNLELSPAVVSSVLVARGYGARLRAERPAYAAVEFLEIG